MISTSKVRPLWVGLDIHWKKMQNNTAPSIATLGIILWMVKPISFFTMLLLTMFSQQEIWIIITLTIGQIEAKTSM
ncbi:MAG: Uncharacterised protein [Methanobacteriota archaeon]|nr:MAG: Uncharacterised protein [Euryarchaeota archaeon]